MKLRPAVKHWTNSWYNSVSLILQGGAVRCVACSVLWSVSKCMWIDVENVCGLSVVGVSHWLCSFVLFHCEQQLGSDGSRPILVQVAESVYRFTLGSVAGGKSHAALAPCIPSTRHAPTHLPVCLPTCPPALHCPQKKRVRETEDNGPSIGLSFALLTRATVAALLIEKFTFSFLFSRSLSPSVFPPLFSVPLSHSVPSPVPLRALGKPSCVDSFVPVWVITRGRMKVGVKGGA